MILPDTPIECPFVAQSASIDPRQRKHTLTDGSLDVTDNVADGVGVGGVLLQLNLNLGDTTAGAGTAENLGDFGVLDNGLILKDRKCKFEK
jgi:hypothetical protein